MDKFSIFLLISVLGFIGAFAHDDPENSISSYTTEDFKAKVVKKNHFVMFYAPWCEHCKRLMPAWSQLAVRFGKDASLSEELGVARVDCTVETALCSEHDVTGYPTLKFFKAGESDGLKFRGTRDLSSLAAFVLEQLGIKDEAASVSADDSAAGEQRPLELTEDSFHARVVTGSHFIKFYAPWCGHCQKLAPTWEELSRSEKLPSGVSVAKVDCTLHRGLCNEFEVKGYPTMLWLHEGKKVEKYSGSRSLEDLIDFVSRMSAETATPANAETSEGSEKSTEPASTQEPAAEDAVLLLNGPNFADTTAKGISFVKFFAPWCGHCKRMAPVWQELAVKVQALQDVRVGKVDCTQPDCKELCNSQEVDGFPTIFLYRDGAKVSEYTGSRSLEDLYQFVTKQLAADQTKDEL